MEKTLYGKRWYQSKTVIINIISLCAMILAYYGFNLTQEEISQIASFVIIFINIILRFITKEPIVRA